MDVVGGKANHLSICDERCKLVCVEPGTDDEDSQLTALTLETVMRWSVSCRPGEHEVAVQVQAGSNILLEPQMKMILPKNIFCSYSVHKLSREY